MKRFGCIVAALLAFLGLVWASNIGSGAGSTPSGLVLIQSQVLSMSAASVTFSSISGSYKNLYFTYQGRLDIAGATGGVDVTFNADSGANYDYQTFNSNSSFNSAAQTSIVCCVITGAGNTANAAGGGSCTVYNYVATVFWKNITCNDGGRLNTSPTHYSDQTTGQWRNTAAITSITLTASSGNFITGTTFVLWGQT